ncbi:mucin-associated surface protein (MASP), putative, partial [Trypanosoma cruzi marinkellei]
MMMTGRVLWVCALCVLWCGVCGGDGTSPTPPGTSVSVAENKIQNVSVAPQTGSATGVPGYNDNPQLVNSTTIDGAGSGGNTDQTAKSSEVDVQAAVATLPQTPLPVEEAKATGNAEGGTEKRDEKKSEKDDEEEEEEEEVVEDGEDEDEDDDEDEGEEEDDEEEEDDKGNVTGAQKRMSAGGQEQPSLSSGAEGASNKTNPNSTQTTDGSTTVSHTTTPVFASSSCVCGCGCCGGRVRVRE